MRSSDDHLRSPNDHLRSSDDMLRLKNDHFQEIAEPIMKFGLGIRTHELKKWLCDKIAGDHNLNCVNGIKDYKLNCVKFLGEDKCPLKYKQKTCSYFSFYMLKQ